MIVELFIQTVFFSGKKTELFPADEVGPFDASMSHHRAIVLESQETRDVKVLRPIGSQMHVSVVTLPWHSNYTPVHTHAS